MGAKEVRDFRCFEYAVEKGLKTIIFGTYDLENPRWKPTSRAQGPTHPRPPSS